MKQIEFSWTGSENSEEGHAIFKCDGVTVLSLPFPEFRQALVVWSAMNLAAALAMIETPMELIKAVLLKHEVAVIEEMGPAANGKFADFKIVEIPDDVEWEICDSGGYEWVAEKHRTWR